jgi:hypothetical protein
MGIGKFVTFCCCLARDWSWAWLKVDLSWPRIEFWLQAAAELHLASVCVCRVPTGPAAAATTPCIGAPLSTPNLTPNSSAAVGKGTTARSLHCQMLRRPAGLQGSKQYDQESGGERRTRD